MSLRLPRVKRISDIIARALKKTSFKSLAIIVIRKTTIIKITLN